MKSLSLLTLASLALAKSRTSSPSGCLSVGKSTGAYSTIQSAVDALDTSSTSAQCIFINPGVYTEQVLVPARRAQLSVYGYTTDTSGYAGNTVVVRSDKSQKLGIGNDETATLRVKSANFRLYNVDVENTFGKGSQAVAVSAYADSGYYGCAFRGFQDTLLAQTGKQVYARTLIQGATDFVFGQHAPAWFEKCDVRVVASSVGYVTGKLLAVPFSLCGRRWFCWEEIQIGEKGADMVKQPPDGHRRPTRTITCLMHARSPRRKGTPSLTERSILAGLGPCMRRWCSRKVP
jgi:pectinesterase